MILEFLVASTKEVLFISTFILLSVTGFLAARDYQKLFLVSHYSLTHMYILSGSRYLQTKTYAVHMAGMISHNAVFIVEVYECTLYKYVRPRIRFR